MNRLPADFAEQLKAAAQEALFAGRYRIEHEIGLGPAGIVYRAIDHASGQIVALKILRRIEPAPFQRFAAELAGAYAIGDPGVARILGHGVSEEDGPWVVAQWIAGESLSARLRGGIPLAIGDVLVLGARLSRALSVIHAHRMIHGNIKATNVHLQGGRFDQPVLLDLGLARLRGVSTDLGSAEYTAPERARGVLDVDGRADLFSLGSLLFRCLTNVEAFEGASPFAALAKSVLYSARRVKELRAGVPAELDELIAHMLAADRDERPPSAAVVEQTLVRLFHATSRP